MQTRWTAFIKPYRGGCGAVNPRLKFKPDSCLSSGIMLNINVCVIPAYTSSRLNGSLYALWACFYGGSGLYISVPFTTCGSILGAALWPQISGPGLPPALNGGGWPCLQWKGSSQRAMSFCQSARGSALLHLFPSPRPGEKHRNNHDRYKSTLIGSDTPANGIG